MKKLTIFSTFVSIIFILFITGCGGPASDGARIANRAKEASEVEDFATRKLCYETARLDYQITKEKYSGDELKAFEAAYVKAGGAKYYNPSGDGLK